MIKAIIFDCFGVLTVDRWKSFCDQYEGKTRDELVDLTHARAKGFFDREEFVKEVSELVQKPKTEISEALEYGNEKNIKLFEYIKKLKDKGLKTAILSNVGTSWVRDTFLDENDRHLFDEIVLSFEVGLAKPDTEIFNLVVNRLGAKREETIFIDDSLGFCNAARELGINSIFYEDFPTTKNEIEKLIS